MKLLSIRISCGQQNSHVILLENFRSTYQTNIKHKAFVTKNIYQNIIGFRYRLFPMQPHQQAKSTHSEKLLKLSNQ